MEHGTWVLFKAWNMEHDLRWIGMLGEIVWNATSGANGIDLDEFFNLAPK
ncbi:hypothetical protein LguiA_019588 [Lonicera macranthoides]